MTLVSWPGASDDGTLFRLQHTELRGWLTEALLLPEPERLLFTLYYYERLTTEEIKLLGDTESSISQLPGCSSFSCTGITSALVNLTKVRRLWIDRPIQSKANIPEPAERGNTS
jgi:hypothetical protein